MMTEWVVGHEVMQKSLYKTRLLMHAVQTVRLVHDEQLFGHSEQEPLKLKNLSGHVSSQRLLYKTPVKQLKQVDDELIHVLHSPVHETHTPFNASMNKPSPQSLTQELSSV